ncbi:hypothetical protein JTB14_004353 [Gonioctena quinquepunctata]|nr:hypothetical protein JTB14_004353 [Gonioctena quinquepunctata]
MRNTSKNIGAECSEEQLQAALAAIRNNESQRSVAQRFGIPRRTLRNHLRSGKNNKMFGPDRSAVPGSGNRICIENNSLLQCWYATYPFNSPPSSVQIL